MPRYTFIEPEFNTDIDQFFIPPTNLLANGPVHLFKENNVTSEQTFLIVVQVSDSVPPGGGFNPATNGLDYSLGARGTSPVIQFTPQTQRLLFSFELISDTLPEGNEAFLLSTAPEDEGQDASGRILPVPGYLPPIALSAETFVIIEDDDRKLQ